MISIALGFLFSHRKVAEKRVVLTLNFIAEVEFKASFTIFIKSSLPNFVEYFAIKKLILLNLQDALLTTLI